MKKLSYYWRALPLGLRVVALVYLTSISLVGGFLLLRGGRQDVSSEAVSVSATADVLPAVADALPKEIVVDSVDKAILAEVLSADTSTTVVSNSAVGTEEMFRVANNWLQPQVTRIGFRIAELRKSLEKDKLTLQTDKPQIEPLQREIAVLEEELHKARAAMDLPVLHNSSFNEEVEQRYYHYKARLDKARKQLRALTRSVEGLDKRIAHRETLIKQLQVEAAELRNRLDRVRNRDLKLLPIIYAYATSGVQVLPLVSYAGRANWDLSFVEDISIAFERQFNKKMPISAYGQSETHTRMGWDHANSADVPVHPDSEEGQWLFYYLTSNDIPFMAFRHAVPGISTGPHFHIGHPSQRLRR
ncbi:MAG: hypothetical protein RMM17_01505 [Acidobacteriota bacterium]|nr:hypothetical protein [Blastocatellia bacterium]MDW8411346.1 hypothetical protein [Acidobacteriota bacterium]